MLADLRANLQEMSVRTQPSLVRLYARLLNRIARLSMALLRS